MNGLAEAGVERTCGSGLVATPIYTRLLFSATTCLNGAVLVVELSVHCQPKWTINRGIGYPPMILRAQYAISVRMASAISARCTIVEGVSQKSTLVSLCRR